MSTATFAKPEAAPKPTTANFGRVAEILEPRLTEQKYNDDGSPKPRYINQEIRIEGYGASDSLRVYLLYRQEWLTPGFRPNELKKCQNGEGLFRMYGQNIAMRENDKGDVSNLQGLVGCDPKKFDELAGAILNLPQIPLDEEQTVFGPSTDDVKAVLQHYLIDEGYGSKLIYTIRQRKEKSDQIDPETGRPVWENTKYTELERWYPAVGEAFEKTLKRLTKRAEKAAEGTFLMRFNGEEAF